MCSPFYCKFSTKLLEPSEKCVIISCLILYHSYSYLKKNKKNMNQLSFITAFCMRRGGWGGKEDMGLAVYKFQPQLSFVNK